MKTLTVSKCPQITSWVFRAHSSKILAIVGRQPFHTYNLYRICEELLKWVKKFGDQNHTFFLSLLPTRNMSPLFKLFIIFQRHFFVPTHLHQNVFLLVFDIDDMSPLKFISKKFFFSCTIEYLIVFIHKVQPQRKKTFIFQGFLSYTKGDWFPCTERAFLFINKLCVNFADVLCQQILKILTLIIYVVELHFSNSFFRQSKFLQFYLTSSNIFFSSNWTSRQ